MMSVYVMSECNHALDVRIVNLGSWTGSEDFVDDNRRIMHARFLCPCCVQGAPKALTSSIAEVDEAADKGRMDPTSHRPSKHQLCHSAQYILVRALINRLTWLVFVEFEGEIDLKQRKNSMRTRNGALSTKNEANLLIVSI